MLALKFAKIGKNKQPTFRLIVTEKTKDPYGRYLELLGHYNPRTKVSDLKKDRILHWLSVGAQATPTVHNFLVDQNIIQGKKVKASSGGKKKGEEKPAASPKPAAPASAPAPAAKPAAKSETKTDSVQSKDTSQSGPVKADLNVAPAAVKVGSDSQESADLSCQTPSLAPGEKVVAQKPLT